MSSSSGPQKLMAKSPAFAALVAARKESTTAKASLLPPPPQSSSSSLPSSRSSTTATTRNPPKPMVLKRRTPVDLVFRKPPIAARLLRADTTNVSKEKAFELVQPSPEMKPYRMMRDGRRAGKAVAHMRKAAVPKFLISPIAEDNSAKTAVLEELIKEGMERKRLEKVESQRQG